MMTAYQKFGFIAGQILFGFLYGIAGFFGISFISYIFSMIFDFRMELYSSILYAVIGGYIGMLFGVGMEIYKLFNNYNKNKEFWRFIIQGLVAYAISLLILYYFLLFLLEEWSSSGDLVNVFAIAFPLIFLIIFSNYKIFSSIEKLSKQE